MLAQHCCVLLRVFARALDKCFEVIPIQTFTVASPFLRQKFTWHTDPI